MCQTFEIIKKGLWPFLHFKRFNAVTNTIIALMTPDKAKRKLADNMRERRLAMNLTQAGLSKRFGNFA